MADETYHQRIREEKLAATIQAAMELFLGQGYERTSLQQIAKRADLSTSTLFKQFPTKTVLFEAIVEKFWALEKTCENVPQTGEPTQVLRKMGLGYAHRMRQPEVQAVYRLIVAETIRFPDLGLRLFDKGIAPYLNRLNRYLTDKVEAGVLNILDITSASQQFLAMIAGQVLWPELLVPGCGGTEAQVVRVVEDAVETMLARYEARENVDKSQSQERRVVPVRL